MSDHIVKAYDKELEILGRKIAEMGGIAEKMLSDAMDSLVGFDTRLAQTTVDSDPRLDLLQRDIEEQAIRIGRKSSFPLLGCFAAKFGSLGRITRTGSSGLGMSVPISD
jgi:phosphate uptake regulator